jgi:hypothetical protein
MRQNAWLDFAFGIWHLVEEGNDNGPVRWWESRESATSDLESEGWIQLGPFPRRYRGRWRLDKTFTFVRFIQ